MAKYFGSQMSAPINVPRVEIGQHVSPVSRPRPTAPSDREMDRRRAAAAYEASLEAPAVADAGAAVDSAESSGMSLNVPGGTKRSPEEQQKAYVDNLNKLGLVDFAKNQEAHVMDMQRKQTELDALRFKSVIEHESMAFDLVNSGAVSEGLALYNKVNPENPATNVQVVDKNNIRLFTKNSPQGDLINRHEFGGAVADAKTKAESWAPLKLQRVGDSWVATQTDQTGKVQHVATVKDPAGMDKLSPFERKAQEEGAMELVKVNVDNQKISAKSSRVNDAASAFVRHLRAGYSTGSQYAIPGSLQVGPQAETAQAVDRAFKALNLEEMVSMFQGMSRAVDSDAERSFFEAKQPGMTNKPLVNAQIFAATAALTTAKAAENEAYAKYINANQSVKDYVSPVLGKQQAMFDKDGVATLVPNEQVVTKRKEGFMSATEMAEKMLKDGTVPKVGKLQAEPVVVEERTTKDGVIQKMSDGTLRKKK